MGWEVPVKVIVAYVEGYKERYTQGHRILISTSE